MLRRALVGIIALIGILVAGLQPLPAAEASAAEDPAPSRGLRLPAELPRDSAIVVVWSFEDPAKAFDHLRDLAARLPGSGERGALDQAVLGLERRLGTPLSSFAGAIGNEIALVVDVPDVDAAFTSSGGTRAGLIASLLASTGIVMSASDPAAVEAALVKLLATDAAPSTEWPTLHHAAGAGRVAIGFSRPWVEAAVRPRPEGERLVDGADWRQVFSVLDSRPDGLYYVNLPRLRERVESSHVLRHILNEYPVAALFVQTLLEGASSGYGSTSVAVEGGIRSTSFGTNRIPGGVMKGGLVAAAALPALLQAADRGRIDRTTLDLRAIADACDRFSGDAASYPGPTEGWVPVERIAGWLEPAYIRELPRHDAWRRPLLYWSDGGSYRIISVGGDGKMDQDWSTRLASPATGESSSDIVVGDGSLYLAP